MVNQVSAEIKQIESGSVMEQSEVGGWKPDQNLMILRPALDLEVAMSRLRDFQKMVKAYFKKDVDYGIIPGTDKPTLYKSGADKFCDVYGLTDEYEIIDAVRDWEKGLFGYEIRCRLTYRGTNVLVSSGMGSCSTWEGKFRWRNAKRECPECGARAIIKGNPQFNNGVPNWVCHKKQDGCGAKFTFNDGRITKQEAGRIENPDIHDQINNVLKSAKKRAKVDAVLSATRSSGLFTQDLEEMPPEDAQEPTGYVLEGRLVQFVAQPNGIAVIALEKEKGKVWKIIAHEETAKLAAKMLDGLTESGTKIRLKLDCIDAIAPNNVKYIKLVQILEKEGMEVGEEPIFDEGWFSKCLKHGEYKGEGNCPKCEAGK